MKTSIYLLISLFCLGTHLRAQKNPAPQSCAWTAADFARFTPATFRAHPAAGRVMDWENPDYCLLSAAIFFATNEQRIRKEMAPFLYSSALRSAAQTHSHDMAIGGFFSHNNPLNPSRRTPWKRMHAVGVTGGYRAENIASCSARKLTYLAAADLLVGMWMKSPGHRANLLDRKTRYLGCGVHTSNSPRRQLVATQDFASEVPSP